MRQYIAIALISIVSVFPSISFAQSSIPQDVIDRCNATADAGDLPSCLRYGSLGSEMLEAVVADELYGEAAIDVVEACKATNDTYGASWTCFKEAAEDAVETESLIGRDNIADQCVASISDGLTYTALEALYQARRSEVLPDEFMYFGVLYHPFKGCPVVAVADMADEAAAVNTIDQDDDFYYSDEVCAAYAEVEEVISGSSARQLREMANKTSAFDVLTSEQVSDIFRISPSAAELLTIKNQSQGCVTLALLGAFLSEQHPDLLDEYVDRSTIENGGAGSDIDPAIARNFLMSISDSEATTFRTSCGS